MSKGPSLHNLIMAISNAVLQAQEKVEAAQLNNLMSYFYRKPGHKGYFPLSMRVNLPSMQPGAQTGDTEAYRVPYLSALPYSSLRIKQVDVNFDVAFGGLTEAESPNGNQSPLALREEKTLQGSEDLPNLSVDMSALRKGQNVMAHVKLTLEGVELPEGTARLINELIKTSQTYEPPSGKDEAQTPEENNGAKA